MHTSSTPRLRNAARIAIHACAPSPPEPAHSPSTSRSPWQLMPSATYTGRFATLPSRIFTKIASISSTR
jgi:hypothetical protein